MSESYLPRVPFNISLLLYPDVLKTSFYPFAFKRTSKPAKQDQNEGTRLRCTAVSLLALSSPSVLVALSSALKSYRLGPLEDRAVGLRPLLTRDSKHEWALLGTVCSTSFSGLPQGPLRVAGLPATDRSVTVTPDRVTEAQAGRLRNALHRRPWVDAARVWAWPSPHADEPKAAAITGAVCVHRGLDSV